MENKTKNKIEKISHFRKLSPVNLQFQDLTYAIPQGRKESKLILRSISGQFRSGHLSAILGSSGSGKTTLLNVLAGYKTIGVNGTLMVNGHPLVLKEFLQLSRYIMHQNLLQSFLTVQESMIIAADLKLSRELDEEDKVVLISEVLEILRLTSVKDTLSNKLSGGERKRLSIALELINNPPIIFLDEPTTGLDEVSSSQCISLLKTLAEGGRTIICSIHTPSAQIFEEFHNVYVLSDGSCAYQGCGKNVVPFLSNLGLSCPKHYNPADFVVEVTSGQYGEDYVENMTREIENGRNASYCNDNSQEIDEINNVGDSQIITSLPSKHRNECFRQFKILLYRRCLQTTRNKQYLLLKIIASIMMGVFTGSFYFDVGQEASKVIFNITFCFVIIVSFIFFSVMPIALYFPPEVKLLQIERFNKWYGLTAYYLAMTVATLPMHIIMVLLINGISYVMSAQPMELGRFILTNLICFLVALIADSYAVLVSSVLNVNTAVFFGPVSLVPLIILSCFGVGVGGSFPILVRIAMYCNFVRYGYEGFLLAIYGNGRSYLECPEEEIICRLKDPKTIIRFIGLQNTFIWLDIIALVFWFFIFRIAAFFVLRIRLQANHPFRSVKYLVQNVVQRNNF